MVIEYDGKTYHYFDGSSETQVNTDNYFTVDSNVRIVAAKQKIGALNGWLIPEADRYKDDNKTDCFKRNFVIRLHDVSAQDLYNFLQADKETYYRLKRWVGGINAAPLSEFLKGNPVQKGKAIPEEYYTIPGGEYQFHDGISFIYKDIEYHYKASAPTEEENETVGYFTVEPDSIVVAQDRVHDPKKESFLQDENGWLDGSKATYPTPITNGIKGFHRDYVAKLYPPKYIPVKLVADSQTVTYNGQEQTITTYKVYQETKEISAVFNGVTVTIAGTDAGEYTTTEFSGVTLGETKDKNNKYVITAVEDGKLTINPKDVTVTAKSEEFTYDGTVHSNDGYDVEGLEGNDAIDAVVTGSITFPSESPAANVLTSYKFTTGTPGNYNVTTVNG